MTQRLEAPLRPPAFPIDDRPLPCPPLLRRHPSRYTHATRRAFREVNVAACVCGLPRLEAYRRGALRLV